MRLFNLIRDNLMHLIHTIPWSKSRKSLSKATIFLIVISCTSGSLYAGSQINSTTTSSSTDNVGFGYNSLSSLTTGDYNTATGYSSLKANTTGNYNTAVGSSSLGFNTTGAQNTALGFQSLLENTTGSFNTAIGINTINHNTTGSLNTAVGISSQRMSTTGAANTSLGSYTLPDNRTGSYNTVIGESAGYSNLTGSNNVLLGYKAGYSETGSNKLYVANSNSSTPLIYGDFSTGALALGNDGDETGAIQIGTSGTRDITIGSSNATTVIYGLRTSTITDASGNNMIRKDSTTGAIHIGQNSMVFDDSSGSVGNGTDIMSSTVGKIQIGKSSSDSTTVVGELHVQNPTQDSHAASRAYVDGVGALAAALDTRLPVAGKNNRVSLNTAQIHNQNAVGLSLVGIMATDKGQLLDYSLGLASSSSQTMSKLSVGFSF